MENLLYNFLDQSLPQQLFPASKPWAGQEVAAHEPSKISAVTNREILVFLLGLLAPTVSGKESSNSEQIAK